MAAHVGAVQKVYADSANFVVGSRRIEFRQIQLTDGTNHYTTGGYLFSPSEVGMKHIDFALVTGPATSITNSNAALVVKMHSQAGGNQRIHVYKTDAEQDYLAEMDDGTDLAGWFVQVAFFGW